MNMSKIVDDMKSLNANELNELLRMINEEDGGTRKTGHLVDFAFAPAGIDTIEIIDEIAYDDIGQVGDKLGLQLNAVAWQGRNPTYSTNYMSKDEWKEFQENMGDAHEQEGDGNLFSKKAYEKNGEAMKKLQKLMEQEIKRIVDEHLSSVRGEIENAFRSNVNVIKREMLG